MAIWSSYLSEDDAATMAAVAGRDVGFGDRPALLIVDMTYAFADGRFPLGDAQTGPDCIRSIVALRAAARAANLPVIYSRGMAAPTGAQFGRWKFERKEPAPGLPDPNEIVPELTPSPDEMVVRKRRPSAFFGTELASLLTYHRVDTVILTGMVTSGCVRATAVDAFSYNLRVVVPEECVADRTRLPHAMNLFDIHMKYGDVTTLREVVTTLDGLVGQQVHLEGGGRGTGAG